MKATIRLVALIISVTLLLAGCAERAPFETHDEFFPFVNTSDGYRRSMEVMPSFVLPTDTVLPINEAFAFKLYMRLNSDKPTRISIYIYSHFFDLSVGEHGNGEGFTVDDFFEDPDAIKHCVVKKNGKVISDQYEKEIPLYAKYTGSPYTTGSFAISYYCTFEDCEQQKVTEEYYYATTNDRIVISDVSCGSAEAILLLDAEED